eukprot:m.128657 g.128657  ORF g.128657 m.128657 type:complete len:513 (+) comp15835_c0_seq4:74-1612(+)
MTLSFDIIALTGFATISPTMLAWALVLASILFYHVYYHRYWQGRGVGGPTPIPLFGTHLKQFFVPMQVVEKQRYDKYGKIYGIYDGGTPALVVGDPKLIKTIMTGSNALKHFHDRRSVKTDHPVMSKFLSSLQGEEWLRVRNIAVKAFNSDSKLRQLEGHVNTACLDVQDKLAQCDDGKQHVDLKQLWGDYTMDVIASVAFGVVKPTADFVSHASSLFTFPFWRKFLDYTAPKWLLEPLGFTVLPKPAMDFFQVITEDLIEERKSMSSEETNFLQMMLDVESSDEQLSVKDRKLTHEEIVAQSVLFFSVGYETSSQVLVYTSYLLGEYPLCQRKLYEEVKAIVDRDGELNHDNLKQARYLRAVVEESMRLYNPVLRMERRANCDFSLGDTGIVVEKGTIVVIPVWAIHHDPDVYPNPEVFDPERFMDDKLRTERRKSSVYLPFGQGKRDCIGKDFAIMEIRAALAKTILNYQFLPSHQTPKPLQFVPTGRPLLGPRNIFARVSKRDEQAHAA